MRELISDSHKLSFHHDRLNQWENNERIAPISVDMALTRLAVQCVLLCNGSRTSRKSYN